MCIRTVLVMCRVFLLCVLDVFLLSAKFESYCDKQHYCYKKYTFDFKSGSISSISIKREDITDIHREDALDFTYGGDYLKLVEKAYPDYSLSFVIDGEHRAIDIKSVVFDGLGVEPLIFEVRGQPWELAEIKDFQMEPPDVNLKFTEVIFPVSVRNVVNMRLKKLFVDKLKANGKIKITLISAYNTTYAKEFVLAPSNFKRQYVMRQYDFDKGLIF
ncbi:hypothetical protein bcCo53_001199 (plasmid) [Borrelia coriaceae]|nr:hypothetical protein [Borrelia coriaceae]UPA17030.1 hypothetical protein bcCo53_001199 [Borrelia coriaceae]